MRDLKRLLSEVGYIQNVGYKESNSSSAVFGLITKDDFMLELGSCKSNVTRVTLVEKDMEQYNRAVNFTEIINILTELNVDIKKFCIKAVVDIMTQGLVYEYLKVLMIDNYTLMEIIQDKGIDKLDGEDKVNEACKIVEQTIDMTKAENIEQVFKLLEQEAILVMEEINK